jgi:cytochrome c oxidase subunit 3
MSTAHSGNTAHSIALEHHKDYTGSKIGIWLFLITEVILFGGLFLLYAVYRSSYAEDFHNAADELDTLVGASNTIILLTSSLSMALSIAAVHHGNRKLAIIMLAVTVILGGWFMVNKYFEWGAKISHGIYPGSAILGHHPKGEIVFFGLYFSMTGLHGIHVVVGMVLLTVMIFKVMGQPRSQVQFVDGHGLEKALGGKFVVKGRDGGELWSSEDLDDSVQSVKLDVKYWPVRKRFHIADFNQLENSGLYWHIVDVIWIFLFPLFYLIT